MIGVESSRVGVVSVFILPSSLKVTSFGFLPKNTFVSIGSRSGSIGGFVTCEALSSILSQYTGYSFGLPIAERRTPPVSACLYTSVIVCWLQLELFLNLLGLSTIFNAPVGQMHTQRWQSTHCWLSDIILSRSPSYLCTSFAHCLAHA